MSKQQRSVGIYARVSTDRQAVDTQLAELRDFVKRSGWEFYQEYIDLGYTGTNTKRPAFTEMMAEARKRKFHILLVWKLDRLGRSMKDLINTLDELGALGIDFVSYENQLDTSTPTGKLLFHVIGAVAEFEKDIIRERIVAGLENAKRKGKRLGKRPVLLPHLFEKAVKMRSEGFSYQQIAKRLRIDESTIRKKMKEV